MESHWHLWCIQKTLKVFKSMDTVALGFLVSLNKYRKKNPASVWISLYLFLYAKGPTPPAPAACPCPRLLQLLVPVVYFLSQAIHLDAMFKQSASASTLPSFHISALHRMCWGTAWIPLFIQHCLQKDLKQPLPLILPSLFLPSCPSNNKRCKTNMQHENCWPVFWQLHWKYLQFFLCIKIVSISSLTIAFRNIVTFHIVIYKCGFKY